ncbi:MAG: DUF1624 domain-containing protein [Bacteroidetes bacterium]|nr:MAG: DUF1624 domain-containing protein [Bacteroidota bacterium]
MAKTQRLLSLDIFRGATIAAMILVNNPGSWSHVYSPLLHAEWHGATVTDWIFPFFIFIVGVAIAYALGSRKTTANRQALVRKILVRTLLIFGIGLFLNGFPFFNFSTIRIPGVLQRIALVYGVTALLFLYQSPRQLLYTAVVCLLGYWALMTLVPIPGGGSPSLAPGEDIGAWLDRSLLGGHLWSQSKTWDPEGLLSTVPAFATSISGILTGLWLRTAREEHEKVAALMVVGTILLGVSLIWDPIFPINKKIWTSSYVLYTSGIAMLILGCIYYLVDIKGYRAWAKPFVVYGTNALFVFVLSGLVAKLLYTIKWTDAQGETISAKAWFMQTVFNPLFSSPYHASLAFALTNVFFFWVLSWILYRRRIFIKV